MKRDGYLVDTCNFMKMCNKKNNDLMNSIKSCDFSKRF